MRGKKTGGRKLGVPNHEKPMKVLFREHSEAYFTRPESGEPSEFEKGLALLTPAERVNAEIRIARYHTPEMKAVDVDATADVRVTIEDTLFALADDEEDEQ